MDKHQRFISAYNYLYERGIIHAQKDLAAALKASAANISTMLKTGNEKVLTDNIMIRLSNAFPGTFNLEWLLNGTGEMLMNHGTQPTGFVADQQHDTPEQQKSIIDLYAGLIQQVERMRFETQKQLSEAEQLNCEAKELKSELQKARQDFVDATYQLKKLMRVLEAESNNTGLLAAED